MTATADLDWVVISLARTPERLEAFFATNGGLGLPIEVVEATDGHEVDRAELIEIGLIERSLTDWSAGAIGAALSHWTCWYKCVDSGRPLVIFEDDVVLRHDLVPRLMGLLDALPDWEIVQLGYNTDSVVDLELSPGSDLRGGFTLNYPSKEQCERFARAGGAVAPIRLNTSFGQSAYVVTPKAAQKLIDGCFPLARRVFDVPVIGALLDVRSADALLNGLYRRMQAFTCVPPLAMVSNDRQTSTVMAP